MDIEFYDEEWECVAEILTQAAILIRAEVAEEIRGELESCWTIVSTGHVPYVRFDYGRWQAFWKHYQGGKK